MSDLGKVIADAIARRIEKGPEKKPKKEEDKDDLKKRKYKVESDASKEVQQSLRRAFKTE